MANGEGQFRSRTCRLEQKDVTPAFSSHFSRQFSELPGKKPRIMGYRNAGPGSILRQKLFDVIDETLRRSADVIKIHRVGSYAWERRANAPCLASSFRPSHNFSDGSAPQSASTERQRFKKTVVQLSPSFILYQFVDCCPVNRIVPTRKQMQDIGHSASQELIFLNRALQSFAKIAHGLSL